MVPKKFHLPKLKSTNIFPLNSTQTSETTNSRSCAINYNTSYVNQTSLILWLTNSPRLHQQLNLFLLYEIGYMDQTNVIVSYHKPLLLIWRCTEHHKTTNIWLKFIDLKLMVSGVLIYRTCSDQECASAIPTWTSLKPNLLTTSLTGKSKHQMHPTCFILMYCKKDMNIKDHIWRKARNHQSVELFHQQNWHHITQFKHPVFMEIPWMSTKKETYNYQQGL